MKPVQSTQPWHRPDRPLWSNCPPSQPWFRCAMYRPCVLFARGKWRMWFVGGDVKPIAYDHAWIGYAESDDGFEWRLHDTNPILTGEHIPWGAPILSTPWVLYDEKRDLFEMWCGTMARVTERRPNGFAVNAREKTAYATSRDGLEWSFHPEPVLADGRAPCVRREGDLYRMWMNHRPSPEQDHSAVYANVYEFLSTDGIHWTRGETPVVVAGGNTGSCVYPSVLKVGDRYFMWHIGHLKVTDGTPFDFFCDESDDGTHWRTDHVNPAYAASRDPARFDYWFVSTPCVVDAGDHLRLYHAASNFEGNFNRFEGRDDGHGLHFAVATLPKTELKARL